MRRIEAQRLSAGEPGNSSKGNQQQCGGNLGLLEGQLRRGGRHSPSGLKRTGNIPTIQSLTTQAPRRDIHGSATVNELSLHDTLAKQGET